MRGFTLIEVLLSVAFLALIFSFSLPLSQVFQNRNDIDLAVTIIAQTLRRAQVLAEASDSDLAWGVKIQTGIVTLFKGESFITRDPAFDEVLDISPAITLSGLPEVGFSKFSGLPHATGTITLSTTNDSRTLTVNEKGTISY